MDVQTVQQMIAGWDGVSAAPHRFGGVEFRIGKVEIGHMHGGRMIDIPFTRAIREVLVREGTAEPHHLLPESGWISFYPRRAEDWQGVLRLFRLSYLQKYGRRGKIDPAAVQLELDALAASPELRRALGAMSA